VVPIEVRADGKSCIVVVRYMGTKRHMVTSVQRELSELAGSGRAVDLFSGMGSVAESMSECDISVVTNDALEFTACISRARFLGKRRSRTVAAAIAGLRPHFEHAQHRLLADASSVLHTEQEALSGAAADLTAYLAKAKHVAGSAEARRLARSASEASGLDHYRLAQLYFSAGYVSYRQAVEIDALRYAIDLDGDMEIRDWYLASWLSAISVLVNAPGHTAQFLRPNTEAAHARMVRTWGRSVWAEFLEALGRTQQVGTSKWRSGNAVLVTDALDLVSSGRLRDIGVIYADPPYTKDQYSRYYHLYETLYRYDYPDAHGIGRVRSDRFSTGFCLKSSVRASFADLCRNIARMEIPLVVSYPTGGLLDLTGTTFADVASRYFLDVRVTELDALHSTMGASNGASKKTATENLYVCTGRR